MRIKPIITSLIFTHLLFAQSDLALTVGDNRFDDPIILKKHKAFIGLRVGFYNHEQYGIHVGIEHSEDANCQELDLTRLYVDLLKKFYLTKEVDIYGTLTTGYELSNIQRFKPNQLILGIGAGIEYFITPQISGFVDIKRFDKQKSDDQDTITTGGIAYHFQTSTY